MFDAIKYFKRMAEDNVLCRQEGFEPVVISSPDNLEGLLEEYRDHDRFIAITDTNTENLASDDGEYGFTKRRAFTVFILSAYEYPDMEARQRELDLCRRVFLQFVSRIVRDKYTYEERYVQFETQAIPNRELGRYYLSGMTGLYFTLYTREPVDLVYDESQWQER